ncbi:MULTISPECIES: hypothetical protein [unclassified Microbulbifer]|uniref:Uncharacterized protein n=1 Tax=Microbulbifer spongiae TaxID=2944933 RepID=A0ABY9EFT2_9GAMM|nr:MULTISPECIES: hypothetical protein [unclassified Microbulbifer]MDP5208707.1 hypothetical protein [Microbulbifer sp. 2205BS26-8]WKD51370.1 hypothetical protein M8T91_08110 [Microbulbifer sp. MI-G]
MFTAVSFRNVKFCAILVLVFGALPVAQSRATELGFSIEEINHEFAEKIEQQVLLKLDMLNQWRAKHIIQGSNFPYPARIAEDKSSRGATPGPYSKGRLTVM